MTLRYTLFSLALLGVGGAAPLAPADAVAEPRVRTQLGTVSPSPALTSPSLLTQAREVYQDLLRARAATLAREDINLYVALGEARDLLRRLASNWQAAGLRAELEALRADLRDGTRPPDTDIWAALVAELDDAYGKQPPGQIGAARQALLKGREAAARGDRGSAEQALDVAMSTPGVGDGAFPLDDVRRDVDIALQAADRDPPDWDGARTAIEHALTQLQWLRPDN